jgi:hypothetical protein
MISFLLSQEPFGVKTQRMARTVQIILGGGLGNQLFMYAAGRALADRVGGKLVLDLSELRHDIVYKRVYLLDRFPITATVKPAHALSSGWLLAERVVRRFPRLADRWGLLDEPFADGLPVFNPRLLDPPQVPYLSLRGYWQNEKYFSDSAATIRQELSPPEPQDPAALDELRRIRLSTHPVAVGIRFFREVAWSRSDPRQTLAAFRECVMAHATREPGGDYFVFTDEPDHLQDPACLGVPFTLMTPRPRNEDAPIDLYLMTQCRTFFIGYSSFHWWGAWLAASPEKNVTYLHFPGRPCKGYAADDWSTFTVS